MNRRWILAIIAANLAAIVALVFVYPHLMVSPGALMSAHASLATDCFACHAPLRGAAPARCTTCHALPDIGIRTTKGVPIASRKAHPAFHQDLRESNCVACHSEHQGARPPPESRKAFSHALLRSETQALCESCHKAPADTLHREMPGGCSKCHAPPAWKPATFDHARLFLLEGDHDTACVTCHVGNDYGRYTCYGCHEHTPSNIRSKHVREGIQDFSNCVSCHRSSREGAEGGGRRRGDD